MPVITYASGPSATASGQGEGFSHGRLELFPPVRY